MNPEQQTDDESEKLDPAFKKATTAAEYLKKLG